MGSWHCLFGREQTSLPIAPLRFLADEGTYENRECCPIIKGSIMYSQTNGCFRKRELV